MKKKLLIILIPFAIYLLANGLILTVSESSIFQQPDQLEHSQAVMILGSRVYNNGRLSDVLRDRAITAVEVYRQGKADKILVSGDHGQEEYDEVNAVKDYLLSKNVPAKDIFLDHAGFDTFDSLYRAKHVFRTDSLIISTQEFHLPRAVFIGKSLGIKTAGIVSDRQPYVKAEYFKLRESIARVKALFNIILMAKSKYGGEPIPISGDGQLTWD